MIKLKCYYCDTTIKYEKLRFVLRLPTPNKYVGVCEKCYSDGSKAMGVGQLKGSEYNDMKLKKENMLELP